MRREGLSVLIIVCFLISSAYAEHPVKDGTFQLARAKTRVNSNSRVTISGPGTSLEHLTPKKPLETKEVNLDNSKPVEVITFFQHFAVIESIPAAIEGTVGINKSEASSEGSFSMQGELIKYRFIKLNKDDYTQLVVWSVSGMHSTNLAIYGYKEGELYKIFESGSAAGIEVDFDASPPIIKVGIAKLDEEGWSYADKPDWEVWIWDGGKFTLASLSSK